MDAKYEEFWKIEDLREKLRDVPLKAGSSARLLTKTTKVSPSARTLVAEPAVSEELTPTERKKRQWSLAARPAVKLLVKEEGWYRVTQPELVAAGLDPNCKPKYLKLFVDGEQQAILVTGARDGRFDPADAIEFYGTGLDTQFTDTRVYWLVVGTTLGKRIQAVTGDGNECALAALRLHPGTEYRTYYLGALVKRDEDNFLGLDLEPHRWMNTIYRVQPCPATPEEGDPQGRHSGYTYMSLTASRSSLTGGNSERWPLSDQNLGSASFKIPHKWLVEGDNLVTFQRLGGELKMCPLWIRFS